MKIIIMQGFQTENMTTHAPNVMETLCTLTDAVQTIVNRDKIITSMLLSLPEHQSIINENVRLKAQLNKLKDNNQNEEHEKVGDAVRITIHEKTTDNSQALSAQDIRQQYGVEAQNILKDVKTVTAQLGTISLDSSDNNDDNSAIKKNINDFSQKLYELVDSVDTSNNIYSELHAIADEFETTFKPWLVSAIPKQSLINLIPVPRTTNYNYYDDITNDEDEDDEDEDNDEEEEDDDGEEEEDDDGEEEDDEEEEEEDDDDDDEEEDGEEDEDEEDDDGEEEDDEDEDEAAAQQEVEDEYNELVKLYSDQMPTTAIANVDESNKNNDVSEEDLSEEEEDDGTTNTSEDEEDEDDDGEEEKQEVDTSSEELVVCEMEDEDGNALEYLTNDPEEMNGDIFELLDGDEVGKKIGRFVNGEPEFFD